MPIVSISKIQHRYGLSENLPQLAAAEFGWAIDQRRLFIGNGPTAEGAPSIGNTEILTQYTNLLEVAENAYSYKDAAVGYEAITGQSLTAPTTRSLQEKLDDFANVRDYGAFGNGVDDDTDAINRAMADLYTRDTNPAVRRILYFPAGKYLISEVIKIPPYASIQGEGKSCTIISATNSLADCVVRVCDSKLQVGSSIGANNAVLPDYIVINDITFSANNEPLNIFIINSSKFISFNRVAFDGGPNILSAPSSIGSQLTAVKIFSTPINHCRNITFNDCEFAGTNYGSVLDDDMENIIFDKCIFRNLHIALKIGENTLGSGSSIYGPRGLRITNSLFDGIYNSALINYQFAKVTSAFNTYLDVGNQNVSTPYFPVIIFNNGGAASICDTFARTDLENETSPRISYNATKSIFIEPTLGVFIGKKQFEAGDTLTFLNNTTSATNTSIIFNVAKKNQKLHYIATRGTGVRSGILEITATEDGITYSDTFTENGTDIGLTLTAIISGLDVIVRYQTTNASNNITFSYSVDRNLV